MIKIGSLFLLLIFPAFSFSEVLWVGDVNPHWLSSLAGEVRIGSDSLANLSVIKVDGQSFRYALNVRYPEGSWSPTPIRVFGRPFGGAEFRIPLNKSTQLAYLRYYVRFPVDFDFVRGGKLPGLYGGVRATGGQIPDGYSGFTARYMWGPDGIGMVYAYLPTSTKWGTPIGFRSWSFIPGKWHSIEQMVMLNDPAKSNGEIRVWIDGNLVINQSGLIFRKTLDLKIDGLLFSTFFGGADSTWATPKDQSVQFADFIISSDYIGYR